MTRLIVSFWLKKRKEWKGLVVEDRETLLWAFFFLSFVIWISGNQETLLLTRHDVTFTLAPTSILRNGFALGIEQFLYGITTTCEQRNRFHVSLAANSVAPTRKNVQDHARLNYTTYSCSLVRLNQILPCSQ